MPSPLSLSRALSVQHVSCLLSQGTLHCPPALLLSRPQQGLPALLPQGECPSGDLGAGGKQPPLSLHRVPNSSIGRLQGARSARPRSVPRVEDGCSSLHTRPGTVPKAPLPSLEQWASLGKARQLRHSWRIKTSPNKGPFLQHSFRLQGHARPGQSSTLPPSPGQARPDVSRPARAA